MNTKLSIIVPVYNIEKYIYCCIESIYKQDVSHNDFEVIVVNDGSKDNSIQEINTFLEKHSNLQVIDQENSGQGKARNTGIEAANGDYLWFIDGDDFVKENCFKSIIQQLTNTDCDVWAMDYISKGDTTIYQKQKFDGVKMTGIDFLVLNGAMAAWQLLYNRDFLSRHQLFFAPGLIHEDYEFNVRSLSLAKSVGYINQAFYHYITNRAGSTMNTYNIKSALGYLYSASYIAAFIRQNTFDESTARKIYKVACIGISLAFLEARNLTKTDKKIFYGRAQEIKDDLLHCLNHSTNAHKWLARFLQLNVPFSVRAYALLKN